MFSRVVSTMKWQVPLFLYFEFLKFYWLTESRGRRVCQISSKSIKTVFEIAHFSIFQDGGCHYLEFSKLSNFLAGGVRSVEMHQHSNFVKINALRDVVFFIFQDGGRSQSWICCEHIWTKRTWWSLFVVPIDAVVLII